LLFGGQESSVNVLNGGVVTLNNVALVMRNVSLTPYTILIVLKLTNVNPGARVCDVVVCADPYANGDAHSIRVIGSAECIYWWFDQLHTMSVVGNSNYPLIISLSTYRYDLYSYIFTNRWAQGTSTACDYGFAMSWQTISVPDSGSDNTLFMFRSGLHYDADQPTITVTEYAEYVPVFVVGFSLSDSSAGPILDVFIVTDWIVSSNSRVGSEATSDNYDLPADLGSSLVSLGPHTLTFCAVNDFGFI
jgi:hypothetical protein